MPAKIIDSRQIAQTIIERLKTEVSKLNFRPLFCDILVGSDPVSLSFVKLKGKRAEEIGLDFKMIQLSENTTTEQLIEQIEQLGREPNLSGLIVQLPLPPHIDQKKILDSIDPSLDADCLSGQSKLVPPTAGAVLTILDSLGLDLSSKQILVVGQGELVGKPVSKLLKQRGLSIMSADRATKNLSNLTRSADVIISGAGQPGLIKKNSIKDGAVLIDAGTADQAGGIVGDIDTASVSEKASYISATPGGVGPVTVAKLLENVVKLAKMKKKYV
ncbi:MAG: bifunctional 5,10-methylenetetrahydrofolate dehydrogenase/5,10-methenyltetrahydrofolate cyclohydrolase [Candidatus Doudnabacteria bacterium]|nr:bifunctional 5,10-methylenetetrahydrofolate dehydrogenase/5,10-methenyltetrahydrofolate cyclohydrolase [Candidatus Doudnabacteria bacterium]